MELNEKRWYVQWFFFSLYVIDRFTDGYDEETYRRRGTNLCHFMRVTLIWAPLVLLLNLAVYGLLLSALVLVPLYYFGLFGSMKIYGVIIGIILAIVFIALLIWAAHEITRMLHEGSSKLADAIQENKARKAAHEAVNGPSFGTMVWRYAVATKRRICPLITFNQHES